MSITNSQTMGRAPRHRPVSPHGVYVLTEIEHGIIYPDPDGQNLSLIVSPGNPALAIDRRLLPPRPFGPGVIRVLVDIDIDGQGTT